MSRLDDIHRWLGDGWEQPSKDKGFVYQSAGGTRIIDIKLASRGVRDLHAALMQLALVVEESPQIERAYLIAELPRMTRERAEREWGRVCQVLRPRPVEQLTLIGRCADGVTVLPATAADDDETRRLSTLVEGALRPDAAGQTSSRSRPSAKFFEVWKVLLGAWLVNEGPLRVGEVADRAGCSYPTVAKALERLGERREIERDSSRSVTLRVFPRETLREVLVLADTLRRPTRFIDATGREPDPQTILRRLQARRPPRVELGGVVAARQYDPHFDLHGLPRLDVMMHEPVDLSWIENVDPALRQAPSSEAAPVLVVRPLGRTATRFSEVDGDDLPIADPVETLLDLYELRLDSQADDLVKAVRGRGGQA